ncbi:MAG: protein-glutamine gamma-glutamyltransferase [Clostridia bacterium]
MIKISGSDMTPGSMEFHYMVGSVQRTTLDRLSSSSVVYKYDSLDQLKFELDLRANIVDAAIELSKSKFSFRTFRESICNTGYWERTNEGGFLLKDGIKPSDGVRDIYNNSNKYGTECATAIVIVYYKALVGILPENLFNDLFQGIYLMNWGYLDSDLEIRHYHSVSDILPGDCRYFKNPDVNPLTPQWQGENVIDLGNGMYYGHGIGIGNALDIINALNKQRKSDARESAYLLDSVTRPGFKNLADKYYGTLMRSINEVGNING